MKDRYMSILITIPTIEQLASLAAQLSKPEVSAKDCVSRALSIWNASREAVADADATYQKIIKQYDELEEINAQIPTPEKYPVSLNDVARYLMPKARPEDRVKRLRRYFTENDADMSKRDLQKRDICESAYWGQAREILRWLRDDVQKQKTLRAQKGGQAKKSKLTAISSPKKRHKQ